MKREIKFRTYSKQSGVMEYITLEELADGDRFEFHWNDYEWMQFTGLKDKNGKEIYEGDIVADKSNSDLVFEVKYNTEKAGYYMPEEFNEEYVFPLSEVTLEVIGNIYENPELL